MIPLKMFPELEKQSSCSMCGKCCEAIRLPVPHSDFSPESTTMFNDKPFIYENFVPMSESEAFSINPNLQTFRQTDEGEWVAEPAFYYSCKMYSPDTKMCNAHEQRPGTCSEFPWYGNPINNQALSMHLNCSYWNDVPIEYWPTGVNI